LVASISSITATSQNIYKLIKDFSFSDSKQKTKIYNSIREMDLEATVKISQETLKNIDGKKNQSQDVLLSVHYMREIVDKIEGELIILSNMTNYNESLWLFKNMRSYDCSSILDNLKRYKKILENRRKLLIESIRMNFYLDKKNEVKEVNTNIISDDNQLMIVDNNYY